MFRDDGGNGEKLFIIRHCKSFSAVCVDEIDMSVGVCYNRL